MFFFFFFLLPSLFGPQLAGPAVPPRPDLHQPAGRSRLREGHQHLLLHQAVLTLQHVRRGGKHMRYNILYRII